MHEKITPSLSDSVINVERLTKDYGCSRGVFDVSIHVNRGEVFGGEALLFFCKKYVKRFFSDKNKTLDIGFFQGYNI